MKSFLSLLLILVAFTACKSPKSSIKSPLTPNEYDLSLGDDNDNMSNNGEFLLLSKLIKPNGIVFDVGANVGDWTKAILDVQSDIHIYAFEPTPAIFKELDEKYKGHPAIKSYQLAVGSEIGETEFYLWNKETNQHSVLNGRYYRDILTGITANVCPTKIKVPLITIDDFCHKNGVSHIDFLKIDTEGGEQDVVFGAKQMIGSHAVNIVQFEYGGCYKDANTKLETLYNFFTQNGYHIYKILPNHLIEIKKWDDALESYKYSNYLAISKEFPQPVY